MEYIYHIAILVSIYGIRALAQNLVMGSTGLLTVAGAAFYGIGAYTVAILATKFGLNIFLSLLLAPILAGIVAALLARGVGLFEAAQAGAYVNGRAGELASSEFGESMVASDLFSYIWKAIESSKS